MQPSSNVDAAGASASSDVAQQEHALAGFERERRSEWRRIFDRFIRFKPGVIAAIFVVMLGIVAIFPSVFEPYAPNQPTASLRGASPSWSHPLGRDDIGRDILSRVIRGTQVALMVGIISSIISLIVGVTVGAVSGYFGGWVDSLLSRFVDALMAFPILVLLIVLAAVLGPSLWMTIWIIGLTVWATYARVVRADVLSVRERDFVLAARAIGSNDTRIIMRHVLPNVLGPVIVLGTLYVGNIIILEAALSFLGYGIRPPTASWGNMLSEARTYLTLFPHMAIPPGIMIFLTVLAFNLIGDGLRDAIDPRQKD